MTDFQILPGSAWEPVMSATEFSSGLSRYRVPGGWLYGSLGSNGNVLALAFVPVLKS